MVDFMNHKYEEPVWLRLIREQMSLMTKPFVEEGVSIHETFSLTPDYDVKKFHTTFETKAQRVKVAVSDFGVTGPSRWEPALEPWDAHCEGCFDAFQQAHNRAKFQP